MIRFFNKQKQFEQDVMEQGMQYSSGFTETASAA